MIIHIHIMHGQDKCQYASRIPVHAKVEPAGADEKAPRGGANKAGRQVVVKPVIYGDSDDDFV